MQTPNQHRIAEKPLPARMPFLPLGIGLVLLIAIIIGLQLHSRKTKIAPPQNQTTHQAPAAESGPTPAQPESQSASDAATKPAPAVRPAEPRVAPSSASSSEDVLNRDIPEVPQRASSTIHGTVSVAIRVSVDAGGAVTNAEYATRGPSAYFARIALDSARKWKFKAPQQNGRALPSSWLLHYKFRRNGVDVTPAPTQG